MARSSTGAGSPALRRSPWGDEIEVGGTTLVVQAAPAKGPAEPDAAVPQPVLVSLRVDSAAGEARLTLGAASDEVRLVHENGRWRFTSGGALD